MQLRPYQQEAVTRTLLELVDPVCNPLVVLPTGAGKSVIIAALIKELLATGGRILLLAHRQELLKQNTGAIKAVSPDVNVTYYSNSIGEKDLTGDVVVAGVASINKVKNLPVFTHVIIDEAHMVNNDFDGMYRNLINKLGSVQAIGFSATPFRIKGGYLHTGKTRLFTCIAYDMPVSKLMELGYLCPLTNKSSAVNVDLSNIHTRAGEFIQAEYDAVFNKEDLIKEAVADIIKHSNDRHSWLLFCSSVDHAEKVRDELIKNGISSATITGNTDKQERERIIKLFKERRIQSVTNCDVLTTGFDAPNIDMIAMLRPTRSPGLYLQILGRGLRIHPEKQNCLVLDYGGNILRFGPVDRVKVRNSFQKVDPETIPLKVCPNCREVVDIKDKSCFACDYIWPVKEVKRELKHDTKASTLSILAKSALAGKFDGKTDIEIVDHKFIIHRKAGKPPSIRVDYHVNMIDCVSEWVCPEHFGFAKNKADEWWSAHAITKPPQTIDEFLRRREELAMPTKIKVVLNGNFPQIIDRTIT